MANEKSFWERYKSMLACLTGTIVLAGLIIASPFRPVVQTEVLSIKEKVQIEVLAIKENIEMVELRLDNKIIQDDLENIQQRIWKQEDRYIGQSIPAEVRDEIRELEKEKTNLELKLKEKYKE